MTPSLALFAALLLAPLSTHAAHAATVEVVQSGKAVNLFPTDPGYVFETKDAQLLLKGDGLTFFAKAKLGGQFTLKARLAIEKADGMKPALIFNGVDNFAFDGGRILLDGLHVFAPPMRKQVPWNSKAPASVAAGKAFDLEIRRWKSGNGTASLLITIDGEKNLEIPDLAAEIESIALRPGQALLRIHSMTLQGDVVGGELAASSAKDAATKLESWKTQQATLTWLDISGETNRHVFVAQGTKEISCGHPTTVLMGDHKTMFAVWTNGHGAGCGPMARSDDGGLTWTRLDDSLPPNYSNHQNCPSLYRLVDPQGKERLWVFSALSSKAPQDSPNKRGWIPRLLSEDGGKTWTEEMPLSPRGDSRFRNVMAFSSIVRLKDGSYAGVFHRGKDPAKNQNDLEVVQSISRDGGFTWSDPEVVAYVKGKDLCEPYVFRSPEGSELCTIIRDNQRTGTSMVMFSQNEGKTWSTPVDTPWGLTGDRHQGIQLPDGRLVILFRDFAPGSPSHTKFVAWIGTYDDIKLGRPGQYHVKLLHFYSDCGYPGIHQLPDGTIVATTYGKYWNDDRKYSVVSVRFKLSEIDALSSKQLE